MTIQGTDNGETLTVNTASETVYGKGGNDFITGGSGNNSLYGGSGNDVISGLAGDDFLYGESGEDTLNGDDGNDELYGGTDADTLYGGLGDDLLNGGDGNDRIYAGKNTNGNTNFGNDTFNGGAGNDTIRGGDGNDIINGDDGDDDIYLGYGNNTVDGGAGNDTVHFSASHDQYSLIDYGDGTYTATALPGAKYNQDDVTGVTTLVNVENIQFGNTPWNGISDDICPHVTDEFEFSGNWTYDKANKICETNGSFTVSDPNSTHGGLYIESTGLSTHTGTSLNVAEGTLFANYDGVKTQLFSGKLSMPIVKGYNPAFSVTDTEDQSSDLKFGGFDVKFETLQIGRTDISGSVSVSLPENLLGQGYKFSPISGHINAHISTENNFYLSNDFKLADTQFSLFDIINVKGTEQNISFDSAKNTIKIQGKYEADSIIRGAGVEKISLNLAGENAITITNGEAELKGSLGVTSGSEIKADGWGLSKLAIDVDTKASKYGGTLGVKFPFKGTTLEVEGNLDIITSPTLAVNGFGLKLDGLSIPVGTSGVFLKSVNGKVAHLAPADTAPIAFTGGLELTAGPTIDKKSLATFALEATLDENSIKGTGKLTIIDDKILNATGKAVVDWHKNITSFDGTFSIADGFITTNNNFKANAKFDFTFAGKASLNIPKFVGGLGGKNIADANYRVNFTNDNDMSNDFAAGWAEQNYTGFGLKMKYAIGAKIDFNGNWSIFGVNNIPQTKAVAKEVGAEEPVNLDWIFLMANWENTNTDDLKLQVIDPNGNIIEQADFATHKIEIMNELSSENGVTLIVVAPLAGDWKIEVINSDALGQVNYSSATTNAKPVFTFTQPISRSIFPTSQFLVTYKVADVDSEITTAFYYDTDMEGADGILFQNYIDSDFDPGKVFWDSSGVEDGTYYIYAVTSDGINPDLITYANERLYVGDFKNETLENDSIVNTLGGGKLVGDSGHDKLLTLAGINQIDGGYDSDFIIGGFEADVLNGGRGNDLIIGDVSDLIGGSDRINGGKGNDLLMGGLGADIFSFTSDDGKDVIAQFKADAVEFDLVAGFSATPSGADFQVGVDHIELNGFFNVDSENVLNSISQGEDGAVFSAEGTQITFFGIEATQLSANDFLFV